MELKTNYLQTALQTPYLQQLKSVQIDLLKNKMGSFAHFSFSGYATHPTSETHAATQATKAFARIASVA